MKSFSEFINESENRSGSSAGVDPAIHAKHQAEYDAQGRFMKREFRKVGRIIKTALFGKNKNRKRRNRK
jgi:hypothetical protein